MHRLFISLLFGTLTLHADVTDDLRGDFWQDATIHFRIAENPRQDVAGPIVPGSEPSVPGPNPPATLLPDPTKKVSGDSSVLVRPGDAKASCVQWVPGYRKGWTMTPDGQAELQIAAEGKIGAFRFVLVDGGGRIAQSGSLTVPSDGSWQKMVVPFASLERPADFDFANVARAALAFDGQLPARLWLDAVRFTSPSGPEIALTDQLLSQRMADERATRADRVALTYAGARPAKIPPPQASGKPPTRRGDLFYIFAKLLRNEDVAEMNKRLLEIVSTKDQAIQAQYGIEYSWALSTTPALYRFYFNFGSKSKRFPGRLEPEVEKRILEMLWERNKFKNDINVARQSTWNLTGSENHDLNAKIGCLLTSQIFRQEPEYANRILPDLGTGPGFGYWFHRTLKTGRFEGAEGLAKKTDLKEYSVEDHYQAWVVFMKEYFRERARRGFFVEKNSPGYMGYTLSFIQDLHSYTDDPELKKIIGMFFDLFWSEWAQDQLAGFRGGAKTRANDGVPNGLQDNMNQIMSFYFGGLGNPNSGLSGYWVTDYAPPAVVWNLALNRESLGAFAFVSRIPGEEPGKLPRPPGMERTLICDADSRLLRYSWVTPDYILGSQMDHPLAIHSHLSPGARWHGMTFSTTPTAMIFPRGIAETGKGVWQMMGHETSTYRCLQDGPVLITQQTRGFTIVNPDWFPGGQGQENYPYGVYFSPELDQVEEDDGWIFVQEGNAYVAVRVLSGEYQASVDTSTDTSQYESTASLDSPIAKQAYAWNPERTILRLNDRHSPVLFEAGRRADYATLADFKKHILANKLSLGKTAVPGYYTVTYESGGKKYDFNAANGAIPYVNGVPVDYAPEFVFESPFIKGKYGEGIVTVTDGVRTRRLDFSKDEISETTSKLPQ